MQATASSRCPSSSACSVPRRIQQTSLPFRRAHVQRAGSDGAATQQQNAHHQQQQQQDAHQQQQQHRGPRSHFAALATAALTVGLASACPEAQAFEVIAEPSNALSLPTWAIHVSSGESVKNIWAGCNASAPTTPKLTTSTCTQPTTVAEWAIAIALFWRYAEVTGNPKWKGMSWGMLPALGSAMSACTW